MIYQILEKEKMVKKIPYIKLILISWAIALLIYRLLVSFSYKHELTNGETNNIWKAINVSQGKSIYNDPENLPLDVFQYTPISEFPVIFFAKILNQHSINYVYWITVLGRLYQIACNFFLGVILYKIAIKILTLNKINALLIVLTSISLLTTTAFTIRPDATALITLFATIYFYGLSIQQNFNVKSIFFVSCLIVLNFFCKQDGIFIAIPIGIHLILQRKWKALFFTIIFSVGILLSMLLLAFFTSGKFFFINTILGLKNTMSLFQLLAVFNRAFTFYGFFICIGLVLGIKYCFKYKIITIHFIGILAVFYFLLALATSTKIGSWVNYYTPFVMISIVLGIYYMENKTLKIKIITFVRYSFILLSFIYLYSQLYNYTYPFIKFSANNEKYYLSKYNEFEYLKKKYKIRQNDNIIVTNHLLRNFFAENSIMVNIEYYNQASYSYKRFKKDSNKDIKYIIFNKSEKLGVDFLVNYFHVNLSQYNLNTSKGYYVYILKT